MAQKCNLEYNIPWQALMLQDGVDFATALVKMTVTFLKQQLFLFGKLGGLNEKDAVLAAGYSLSVADNTKQRIWKPQVQTEYERVRRTLATIATPREV